MNAYIIKDVHDNWEIIRSNKPIAGGLLVPHDSEANWHEELEWISVVDDKVVIDQDMKSSVKAARQAAKDQKAQDKLDKKSDLNSIKSALRDIDSASITTVAKASAAIKNIVKFLEHNYNLEDE